MDDLNAKREERRLNRLMAGDSFDATPMDALDVARQRIQEEGANHLIVIWEPTAGGRASAHSGCTISTAAYMLDRAKHDLYEEDDHEEDHEEDPS